MGETGDPTLLSRSRFVAHELLDASQGESSVIAERRKRRTTSGFLLRLRREISSPCAGFSGRRCFFSPCGEETSCHVGRRNEA
ncbi:hypothetical protein BHM03_00030236, partial [Ensete ventricosum]